MTRQTLHAIIAVLFILSGAAALMYQIVWFKYFGLFLGNTTYAQAIVLATFMGGLAIGAWLWGKRADRTERPLAIFAWLEIFIGLYCLLYPHILELVKSAFISIVLSLELRSDGSTVLIMKLAASVTTILIPTILMGGTLPVLVKFISKRIEESGRNVAILYFLNSFGAVVGSVLAGFFFVRIVGLQATIYSAAALDLAVGLISLLLLKIAGNIDEFEYDERRTYPEVPVTDAQVKAAVLIAGFSGLAAMIYEVAWVRMLIPVLGSSTYSFSLMVVAFISGITIGSWIVSASIHRIKNLFGFLAVCQFGIAVSMFAILPLYGRVPYYFWHIAHILNRTDATYPIYLIIQFLISFVIMFIPTLFMGMTLPVASRIASRDIKALGSSVGNVFAVNTIGTVIGSLGAGLALIPLFGLKSTIEIALVLNISCGFGVLLLDSRVRAIKKVLSMAAVAAAGIIYFAVVPNWNYPVTLSGVFRQINKSEKPPSTYREFVAWRIPTNIHYYKEGTTSTVAVVSSIDDTEKILIINGKPDASEHGDMPTQVLLGQIPMLLHPDPERVMVIGFGSGATIGSVLTHPVESVDAIEISPEVIEAAVEFNEVNNRPLEDPRTNIYIDDALSFLKLTKGRYDVIISEPSNPWIAGIGNLYTREFFEESRSRLNPGGLMVQWFHTYEMDDPTFSLVLRTFASAFPHIMVWQSLGADFVIVGSADPITIDFERLEKRLLEEPVQKDLGRIGVSDLPTLLSLQFADGAAVIEYAGAGPLNTENIPYLEYSAPRAFYINRGVGDFFTYDMRMRFDAENFLLREYSRLRNLTELEMLNIGRLHANNRRGNISFAYAVMNQLYEEYPDSEAGLKALISLSEAIGRRDQYSYLVRKLYENGQDNHEAVAAYGWDRYRDVRSKTSGITDFDPAPYAELIERSANLAEGKVDTYFARLGDMYYGIQNYEEAERYYRRAIHVRAEHGSSGEVQADALFLQLARSLYYLGDYEEGRGYAIQAIMANFRNKEAVRWGHKIGMKVARGSGE